MIMIVSLLLCDSKLTAVWGLAVRPRWADTTVQDETRGRHGGGLTTRPNAQLTQRGSVRAPTRSNSAQAQRRCKRSYHPRAAAADAFSFDQDFSHDGLVASFSFSTKSRKSPSISPMPKSSSSSASAAAVASASFRCAARGARVDG